MPLAGNPAYRQSKQPMRAAVFPAWRATGTSTTSAASPRIASAGLIALHDESCCRLRLPGDTRSPAGGQNRPIAGGARGVILHPRPAGCQLAGRPAAGVELISAARSAGPDVMRDGPFWPIFLRCSSTWRRRKTLTISAHREIA